MRLCRADMEPFSQAYCLVIMFSHLTLQDKDTDNILNPSCDAGYNTGFTDVFIWLNVRVFLAMIWLGVSGKLQRCSINVMLFGATGSYCHNLPQQVHPTIASWSNL